MLNRPYNPMILYTTSPAVQLADFEIKHYLIKDGVTYFVPKQVTADIERLTILCPNIASTTGDVWRRVPKGSPIHVGLPE